jgi:diacylglycerol kinase (ATP)
LIIIYNPAAGKRKSSRLWRVLDILSGNGIRVRLVQTRHAGHATEIARDAAGSETLIVAAGGDGTIAEVANGINGSGARLGVIPLGTANVLARELNLPIAPREVAAALAFGRTRRLWPGVAHIAGEERLFVQMLGVGLDAQVVHRLPTKLKRALGRGAYVVQTLRELARYGYPPIRLRIDGREEVAGSVIVSKGTLYAGQYMLAPDAKPGERGFSIALFGRSGPVSALMYGAALPLNLLPNAPGMRLLRGFEVEIFGHGLIPAQADGDPAGEVPITVEDAACPIHVVTA